MNELNNILKYLELKRGLDFSGYRTAMLNRRFEKRFLPTHSADIKEYQKYLEQNDSELDKLIDVLTINVSRFFRNTFDFDFIADYVLPNLIKNKIESDDYSLRVWSAGCAAGEEPYSMAILIKEIIEKEKLKLNTTIIATDIDKNILKSAEEGVYSFDSIKSIKYRLLEKYFLTKENVFELKSEIKEMVRFSEFDMLSKKSYVPPESIYGSFDIILCRNLLIYFNTGFQESISEKLYRALNPGGYLILGEAEIPPEKLKSKFIRTIKYCKIYQKR